MVTQLVREPESRFRCVILTAAFTIVLIAGAPPGLYAELLDTPRSDMWIPDRAVRCMYADENSNTLYIGGDFEYIAQPSGSGLPVARSTGTPSFAWPHINGSISAVVADGSGGWFIGGSFTQVGSLQRKNLAHLLANSTVDPNWNPAPNQAVKAMAYDAAGKTLYVGGDFTFVGAAVRTRLAAIGTDSTSGDYGEALAFNFAATGGSSPHIAALLLSGTTLYAGGNYDTIMNSALVSHARDGLAAIDISTGEVNSDIDLTLNFPNASQVLALAHDASTNTLYFGGDFSQVVKGVTSLTRGRAAAIGGVGSATPGEITNWDPNANGRVNALAVKPGASVFIGGGFSTVNTAANHNGVAAVDAATGLLVTAWGNARLYANDPMCYALAYDAATDQLFIGGSFSSYYDTTQRAYPRLVHVNANTGVMNTAWNANPPRPNATVQALALTSTHVFAGGAFTGMRGQELPHLAALDLASGEPASWQCDVTGVVYALAADPGKDILYVGGEFDNMFGEERVMLAAIELASGDLVMDWAPRADARVTSIAVDDERVYICGSFNELIDSSTNYARPSFGVIGARGAPDEGMVFEWGPSPGDGIVLNGNVPDFPPVVSCTNEYIYVGGDFNQNTIMGVERYAVAAFDRDGNLLDDWQPHVNGWVTAIHATDDFVYVGGIFGAIEGENGTNVSVGNFGAIYAAGTPQQGEADEELNLEASGDEVMALTLFDNLLYVGGRFGGTSWGGAFLGAVDRDPASATYNQGIDWAPEPGEYVYTIAATEGVVFTGGNFTSVGPSPVSRIALFYHSPVISTPTDLPQATVLTPYSETIDVEGAGPSFTYLVVSATGLPAGLDLDQTTGIISGIPEASTAGRVYMFDVRVQDNGNPNPSPYNYDIQSFVLQVGGGSPPALPYTTGFESGDLAPFSPTLGAKARVRFRPEGSNTDTSGSEQGMLLEGLFNATWGITEPSADDPALWAGTDANHHGMTQWGVDGTGATDLEVSFDWLAVRGPGGGNSWNVNMVFEVSQDGGANWTVHADAAANTNGVYQANTVTADTQPYGTFNTASFNVAGVSVADPDDLKFRLRWAIKYALEDTPIVGGMLIDNLSIDNVTVNQAPVAPTSLFVHATDAQSGTAGDPVTGMDLTPVFSAIYNDADNGDVAGAYRVQIASDPAFAALAWDSGAAGTGMAATNDGQRCPNIAYGGPALANNTRYYWRIAFHDDDNATGGWSTEAASFTTVTAPAAPVILTTALLGATEGVAWTDTLSAAVSTPTAQWTLLSTTPVSAWIGLTAAGVLSGTPPAGSGGTDVVIAVRATDGAGLTADTSLTIQIAPTQPTILTAALLPATVGQLYTRALSASGGLGALSWSFTGTPPAWLSLSTDGALSGTPPTDAGGTTLSIGVQVADTISQTATASLSLTIEAAARPRIDPPAGGGGGLCVLDGSGSRTPWMLLLLAAGVTGLAARHGKRRDEE